MWPDQRLLELFGIELPIVQAPMANATAVDIALAVANAGGLGSFPCAALSDDKVAEGVAVVSARTNRPINLNFFCHKPAPPDEDPALPPCALLRLARPGDTDSAAQSLHRAASRQPSAPWSSSLCRPW